jgi:hypothetical protein
MTDFEDRLQRAINRGEQSREADGASAQEEEVSLEESRAIHSALRNDLIEHIEKCVKRLCDHFPGFEYSTVLNEKGWGSRITRDDLRLKSGTSNNEYSRLEIVIRPFSEMRIIEIATKGTIRNRETLNRTNYRFLNDAPLDTLQHMVDSIVIEFAEQFSAQG